jgi:hypothetical protein
VAINLRDGAKWVSDLTAPADLKLESDAPQQSLKPLI